MGRPSSYTPEMAAEICERLSEGQSLREICRADDMPGKSTVMRWLAERAEFRDQYARAREIQADHFADEILEIADDGTNDWVERKNADGSTYETINQDHVQRSRLRIDARKWLMSKMVPKKYGDKQTLAGDPENPLNIIGKLTWAKPE
jgi:hypothetical protein